MKGRIQVAKYVLALDQGTTSSRAIVFDKKGNIVAKAQKEFDQIYPAAGWVEHDPMEILFSQFQAVTSVFASGGIKPEDIAAIGITNQRETTIMWDRETGKPVYNAIVWQCRRTAELCEQIKADGMEEYIKDKTGLVIDASLITFRAHVRSPRRISCSSARSRHGSYGTSPAAECI